MKYIRENQKKSLSILYITTILISLSQLIPLMLLNENSPYLNDLFFNSYNLLYLIIALIIIIVNVYLISRNKNNSVNKVILMMGVFLGIITTVLVFMNIVATVITFIMLIVYYKED